MQALTFSNGKVEYKLSYPQPQVASDEVLIAVKLAGICATDLEIIKGYMGFSGVLGHEFIGTVAKGPRDLIGKRVVAEINCVCGKCDMCHSGLSNHCRRRQVLVLELINVCECVDDDVQPERTDQQNEVDGCEPPQHVLVKCRVHLGWRPRQA